MDNKKIEGSKTFNIRTFFLQWEWLLVLLFIIINVFNANISPYYLQIETFLDAPMSFLDKAFMVMPMAFILLLGEIDISVGSTVALSSVLMAVSYNAGLPMGASIVLCLIVGTACGFINGLILAKFNELPSMIVTLSTMTIYRGIALIILKDQSSGNFPYWFNFLGWGYVASIPFMIVMFVIFAVVFGVILHKTSFGRQLYAMGNNIKACQYSGIKTGRNKIIVYTLLGLMAGVTALFLASRMGSTRPNVAVGYELEVIAMAVLGGFSTSGGKGNIIGAVIATFVIGFLRYGLGLINVSSQVILIIVGLLLIGSVLASNIKPKSKIKSVSK